MDGVLNFLKPPGMSSNAAVIFLRKQTGMQKIGHAGTLDPGACGVLPICIGKATRISAYVMDSKKAYIAEVTFGKRTDTGDSYGKVIEITDAALPCKEAVINALQYFTGRITQQTPAYSAVKTDGKKRYELARKGAELPLQSREVEIAAIEYLGHNGTDAFRFKVQCGKGTYIRTLCEDIGTVLGQCAYMSFLARTECAGLDIADSVTTDELKQQNVADMLLPMEQFLQRLPRVDVAPDQREKLFHGVSVPVCVTDIQAACIYAGSELMGLGSVTQGMAKINTRLVDGE